jgi:hypothetical protein
MSSSVVRTLKNIISTALAAWGGVVLIWLLYSAFDVKQLHLLGDKGPVLIPMLVGAPLGSLLLIFYLNGKEAVRRVKIIGGLVVILLGPILGVILALAALDIIGGMMLIAFPFLVSISSYCLYLLAIHIIGTKHDSPHSNMTSP